MAKYVWKPVELPDNHETQQCLGLLIMSIDMTGEHGPYALCRRVDAPDAPQVEALEYPDGPGGWAYEDDQGRFVAHLTIFSRANGQVRCEFDGGSEDDVDEDTFRAMYPGKWWRVHLPWERPAPAAPTVGSPQGADDNQEQS